MELYEIMLIIRPDLETEEREEVLSGLSNAIANNEGTVSTVLDWRKRRLAYEIEKHLDGNYYLVYFSGPGTIIPEIEHYFRVSDAVIRYMIVKSSEHEFEVAASKAAAEAARAAEPAEIAEKTDSADELVQAEAEETVEKAAEVEEIVEASETEETAGQAEATDVEQLPAEPVEAEEPVEEEPQKEE